MSDDNDALTESEAMAVRAFAQGHLQQNKAQQDLREWQRPINSEMVQLRRRLAEALQRAGASALRPDDGIYVRVKATNSKRSLTQQMINDAVDFFDGPEDFSDCKGRDDVVRALWSRVQAQRIVSGTTILLSRTAPQGSAVVKAADAQSAADAARLSTLTRTLKARRKAFKGEKEERLEQVDDAKPALLDMLSRLRKKSHKVIVDQPSGEKDVYFIRRKPPPPRKRRRKTTTAAAANALLTDIQNAADAAVPLDFQVAHFQQCRDRIAERLREELVGLDQKSVDKEADHDGDGDDGDDDNGDANDVDDAKNDNDGNDEEEDRLTFDRSTRL